MNKEKIIAILGRPNVGKSTLFNRLIGSRKAIIDPIPGVTRDILYGEFYINDKKVKIRDSGGLTDEKDEINPHVQKKSYQLLKDADLIFFMVEAGQLLPIEQEYVQLLRKYQKNYLFIMNKCDSPEKEIYIHDFYQYGIGDPIPISAAHNRNIDLLLEKAEKLLFDEEHSESTDSETLDFEPADESKIQIAIVGKPNVGKSSLLNQIIGKERSIVSHLAGTTRDTVDEEFEFEDHEFVILDTAGIRRKSKVTEDLEYYSVNRAIKTINQADIIILVIDAEEDLSEQDKKITDQIVKYGKGLIVALNKWDLMDKHPDLLKKKKEFIQFKFPQIDYAPVVPISAKTGYGVNKLLKKAVDLHYQLHQKITTSQLNDFIQEVIRKYSPSSKKGVLKIFYGTQVSAPPVEFIFFLNKRSLLTKNYEQYIINRLREHFGYSGVPIKIIFKHK
ncbi:MAG: ribosome biogenesis GTPase Der [Spirochaetes bacterium]|nr:ribosome biogenesis GTPase Der [Spirochaetota bacterium]